MDESIAKTRDRLKSQWLAANRKSLDFRNKADEAGRQAAAIQKALDALEDAMSRLPEETLSPKGRRGSDTQERIVALLEEKGTMGAKEIASSLNTPYSTIIARLRNGPFSSKQGPDDGRSRVWSLDPAAAIPEEVPADKA